jgi:two-component system phosphate regulon sensor histidine kinase PhoR
MWRSRIFWRLFGTFGLLLLASMALLGVVLARRVEQHYQKQIRDNLLTRAVLVQEAFQDWSPERLSALRQRVTALGREIGTRITLLDKDGNVLADSDEDPDVMENHAHRPEVEVAAKMGFGMETRFSTTLGRRMTYAARLSETGSGLVRYVRVALPTDDVEAQLAGLDRIVWSAAAVTAAAAMGLALWLARRTSRPLRELARGTDRIAAGQYGRKVYVTSRDEVGDLAQTFNRMSTRLAEQFAQLEQDRQQLRAILGGMVEGVVALDANQRILFANERAGRLLEFNVPLAVGRKLWEVVRQRALQDTVRDVLNGPEPCHGELEWDGTAAKRLTVHAAPLPGSPPRGAVLVIHDTTELRCLERVRQEFVANVSHELKTPLSVIKACVETLVDGAVDEPQHRGRFLGQITEQADRLHALILDLLRLSQIESGAEVFEFGAVRLAPLVTACLQRWQAQAESKNQRLEAVPPLMAPSGAASECRAGAIVSAVAPDLPTATAAAIPPALASQDVMAWADEEAVGQVLENLVENALKYTPAGGRISVRWWAENGQACLDVADTGIGIPEQDLPRIFERFYRVDKARSRELGGTGLGLAIVKHLVQAMHGTVQATSQSGQGTTFHVRLPRAG